MREPVGTFYTSCRVSNHVNRQSFIEVPKVLVDTGAEFTWIDAGTLKSIGVQREKKDYTFVMANGQQITRSAGFVIIQVGDAITTDEVIFGEPGDRQLLGVRSLEGMNLRIDPQEQKLVAGGPVLAAAERVSKEDFCFDEATLAQMNGQYPMPPDAGTAWHEAYEAGTDMSLIEDSLSKSPWERLLANDDALNLAESLRAGMEKRYAKSQ